MTAIEPGGVLWGLVLLGMLAVLLVVVVRQLRRSQNGSLQTVVIGVAIGLGVVGIGLAASFLG